MLLSGPSGSGKTTTALKLEQELERRASHPHHLHGHYFKTLNRSTAPRTPEGDIDYESPLCWTWTCWTTPSPSSPGGVVVVPKFEFARQMRNDSRGTLLKLDKNEIAIFEGIHALNDDIAGRHPEATTLYISARSDIREGEDLRFKGTWMRISRRAVRDYNFRGTDLVETLSMWYNVRRGEKRYLSPFKGRSDVINDSSLVCGARFRQYPAPLGKPGPGGPRQRALQELTSGGRLRYFPPSTRTGPRRLLLREFIGGGRYITERGQAAGGDSVFHEFPEFRSKKESLKCLSVPMIAPPVASPAESARRPWTSARP